jgi:hypothetical protein
MRRGSLGCRRQHPRTAIEPRLWCPSCSCLLDGLAVAVALIAWGFPAVNFALAGQANEAWIAAVLAVTWFASLPNSRSYFALNTRRT